MTDIVEQLRDLQSGAQWVCGETAATLEDAADEIKRLRAERDAARAAAVRADIVCDQQHDEIERLREEGAEAAVMSNRANNRATSLQMEVYYLKAEIERLRAEVARQEGFVVGGEEALLHALHPEFGSIYDEDGEATAAHKAGRREGIEAAAKVAEWAHMVEPDGGSPTDAEYEVARIAAQRIRALLEGGR